MDLKVKPHAFLRFAHVAKFHMPADSHTAGPAPGGNWRPANVERLSLSQRMFAGRFQAPLLLLLLHRKLSVTKPIVEPQVSLGHAFIHFLAGYTRSAEVPSSIEDSMFLYGSISSLFFLLSCRGKCQPLPLDQRKQLPPYWTALEHQPLLRAMHQLLLLYNGVMSQSPETGQTVGASDDGAEVEISQKAVSHFTPNAQGVDMNLLVWPGLLARDL